MQRSPLTIVHANCADGMCAAYVARAAMPDAEFYGWNYADPPPSHELVADRDVYILDFSFPRDVLLELKRLSGGRLLVIDHHRTAQADLEGLDFCIFDMDRSGAGLSCDVFAERFPVFARRSWLVNYVEDRDLWRNALPETEAVAAAIQALPMASGRIPLSTFVAWADFYERGQTSAAREGEFYLRVRKRLTQEMVEKAALALIDGLICYVATASCLFSEVAGQLASCTSPTGETVFFGAACYQRSDGRWTYSLRSRGDFDVSQVAQRFGGGGHKNAAGFTVPSLVHTMLPR